MTFPTLHTRIAGGLGNQLFQLGTALLLAGQQGARITIHDSTSHYGTQRDKAFNIVADIVTLSCPTWAKLCHRVRFGLAPIRVCINDKTVLRQLERARITGGLQGSHLVDGYFQNCWDNYSVQELVTTINKYVEPVGSMSDAIVMHIRGGDFLTLPAYQVADHEYYRRAINLLMSNLGLSQMHLCVVTDDKAHAASVLNKCQLNGRCTYAFMGDGKLMDDFNMLRHARARIIANSTFSWWAAALGHPDAPIIACEGWTRGQRRRYRLANEILIA